MWRFKERQPGDIIRDPIESEFFSEQRDESIARPLVREAIQNSLDARADEAPTRVRFSVGLVPMSALEREQLLGDLVPHLEADTSGFNDSSPITSPTVGYLTVEDFNTVGLEGDEYADAPPPGDGTNHFYYFWRNVGKGEKAGDERGRWGVGKTVFPAASLVGAFFGLSVRASDSVRSLMGLCVLKNHWMGHKSYQPFGFFADHRQNGFPAPIRDGEWIERVSEAFDVTRTVEPGLSVVIVAPDPELTADRILGEVVDQYFYPIVARELIVEVAAAGVTTVVDREYVDRQLPRISTRSPRMGVLIALARWYVDAGVSAVPVDPERVEEPERLSDAEARDLENLANRFDGYDEIAVRLPVTVHPKRGQSIPSSVTVLGIRRPDRVSGSVVFVRQGLTIDGMRVPSPVGTRFLVVAEDPPLARFLGDAENPAHTRWLATKRVRESFDRCQATINIVRQAASTVHSLVLETQPQQDSGLLRRFFPAPVESGTRRRPRAGERGTREGEVEEPTPPVARPRLFRVSRVEGGFSVGPGKPGSKVPSVVRVKVAYDTATGNPFSRYESPDFRLESPPIRIVADGCAVRRRGNTLELRDLSPTFRLVVTGFDPERDVITDVRAGE